TAPDSLLRLDVAGLLRLAVEQHRARTALLDAASVLRSREPEHVAQHPEQRRGRIDVDLVRLRVDVECEQHPASPELVGRIPTICRWNRRVKRRPEPPYPGRRNRDASAAAYRPMPKIACVTTLCSRAAAGRGARLAAMPAPMPGCISRNGAATVPKPTRSAGPSVGSRIHAGQMAGSSAANAMPIR